MLHRTNYCCHHLYYKAYFKLHSLAAINMSVKLKIKLKNCTWLRIEKRLTAVIYFYLFIIKSYTKHITEKKHTIVADPNPNLRPWFSIPSELWSWLICKQKIKVKYQAVQKFEWKYANLLHSSLTQLVMMLNITYNRLSNVLIKEN